MGENVLLLVDSKHTFLSASRYQFVTCKCFENRSVDNVFMAKMNSKWGFCISIGHDHKFSIKTNTALITSLLRSLLKVEQPYNNVSIATTETKPKLLRGLALVCVISAFEEVRLRSFKVRATNARRR